MTYVKYFCSNKFYCMKILVVRNCFNKTHCTCNTYYGKIFFDCIELEIAQFKKTI